MVLAATAVLYIVGLAASGYANSFYSAAAQAGSTSWKAWFFGSLDAGNSITVDKPPAALWVMGLSVRLFGLNPWSILVPEALMGVAAVGVLYAAVRRSLGFDRASGTYRPSMRAHWAALTGAVVFALTPAATLMFRFNNPDALLVLLEVLASYCVIRATETASRTWLALGRRRDRLRLPHQDAPGVHRAARVRRRLRRRRPRHLAQEDRRPARRVRGHAGRASAGTSPPSN